MDAEFAPCRNTELKTRKKVETVSKLHFQGRHVPKTWNSEIVLAMVP